MNITIFATEDAMQFNLKAEGDHEKMFMKLLKVYSGKVTISDGIDVGMTQGGYLRVFQRNNDTVAITIEKPMIQLKESTQSDSL